MFDLDGRPIDPASNASGCYLIVDDPDASHARMWSAGLPVTEIGDMPWGMREFALRSRFHGRPHAKIFAAAVRLPAGHHDDTGIHDAATVGATDLHRRSVASLHQCALAQADRHARYGIVASAAFAGAGMSSRSW